MCFVLQPAAQRGANLEVLESRGSVQQRLSAIAGGKGGRGGQAQFVCGEMLVAEAHDDAAVWLVRTGRSVGAGRCLFGGG